MKILLVGPYPPPHGGISVHVRGLEQRFIEAGVQCAVLDPGRAKIRLIREVFFRAWRGWTVHLHTNGHNRKSWMLAFLCGLAGRPGAGCILTLHSGMLPEFLGSGSLWDRAAARIVCKLYGRIICVSDAIQDALLRLPVRLAKTELTPAYLGARPSGVPLNQLVNDWIEKHQPVLSTALFFRPEYGFEDLLAAIHKLRGDYPSIGCVVMGDSERRSHAEERILRAGLRDSVLLPGDMDHDVCLGIMGRSDVFVRPTTADGDSISVREAMSLGIPVVASHVGTRPEGAILFPPGDVDAMIAQLRRAIGISERRDTHYASA